MGTPLPPGSGLLMELVMTWNSREVAAQAVVLPSQDVVVVSFVAGSQFD